MSRWICAIDPGNEESAYVLLDPALRPVAGGKMANEQMYKEMWEKIIDLWPIRVEFAIEMIASYGMPVGKEVFDTCVWIGRLQERLKGRPVRLIYRKDEKMMICRSMKANDATIRQALVDRFAPGVSNHGKGTKKAPGWFYGFKADMWAAYAVGVTYHDLMEAQDGTEG